VRPRSSALTIAAVAVVAALVPAATGCASSSPERGADRPPRTARLFAPDSVWNAALSSDAPLDPSSDARVGALVDEVADEVRRGVGPWISESHYSTPLYVVRGAQRRVRVKLDAGSWADSLRGALAAGVPIPRGARPADGSDGHLTIHQPSTDTMWEFWRAVKRPDGWHASWGGVMRRVSQSPGYYTDAAALGLKPQEGWNWGSTATSLPVIGGTILSEELRRGRLDHALALSVRDACARIFTWPAQRTDGGLRGDDCLPEGAHLRLDPSLDVGALDLPPITRILAEAAQRYGIIVRDVTHTAVGFYAEDPTPTGRQPYTGTGGLYGGLEPWEFLPRFPWKHLQLLRMYLCAKAPCEPPAERRRRAGR